MNEFILVEDFGNSTLDSRLNWHCPPENWSITNSRLVIEPDAKTDFWQKTHYGFSADNGHFLYLSMDGDFILSTKVRFYPSNQYDQAGLMVRLSPDYWLKTSVEYEPEGPSRLGAVVTNHGYSDWSTQNYPTDANELELRIRREGDDYIVEYSEISPSTMEQADEGWTQIRIAHLHNPNEQPVQCGLYACSPIAAGFQAEFKELTIEAGRR